MSCPHGEWHEEDCEICQLELKLSLAEQRIDYMEDVLYQIIEMSQLDTCGPIKETIRRIAYDAYIGTPPALMRKE